MNKGAEHTSNSVYFIISESHCYQKCFSRKSEVRAGGTTCAEYKSGGVNVPSYVSSVLFPGEGSASNDNVPSFIPQSVVTVKKNKSKKRRRTDWGTKKL